MTLFFFISCANTENVLEVSNGIDPVFPKNIVFLIGDGMGLSQITLGMYSQNNRTVLERFPIVGLHKSHSSDNLITDSGAGATAFACGVKTYNGAIGVRTDTTPCESILEIAKRRKMKTGLIATSTIVHATPASFAAHNRHRKNYEEIALDLARSELDIIIGGGKKFFQRREDNRNLMLEIKAKGYVVDDFFQNDIENISLKQSDRLLYLTSEQDPIPASMGRDYLPVACKMSMNHLDQMSEDGYFLIIEGSQIDWGGHANDRDYVISEYQEFDQVISDVLNYAEKNGETLVLVTADHETGGLAINPGSTMDSLQAAFTTGYHTATMIPVFAFGPGSQVFSGIYENTAIFDKLSLLITAR